MKTISLLQWSRELIKLIEEFNDYWLARRIEDYSNYPLEMTHGELDEQLWAWFSIGKGE